MMGLSHSTEFEYAPSDSFMHLAEKGVLSSFFLKDKYNTTAF